MDDGEVLADGVAEMSLGEKYLCIRNDDGRIACLNGGSESEVFGRGWREITP